MQDRTVISKNEARDIAGRDINTTNIYVTHEKSAYLERLYNKYQEESKNNPQLISFIEDLDYYNSQVQGDAIIGLENKLIDGEKRNIIWYAKNVKERYHKKLFKISQFSEIAQEINVYLLATVRSYYMLEIYPQVCNKEDDQIISALISQKIVNPLLTDLGDNLFGFTPDDIQGMLYFLTGNCHIKWTA